MENIGILTDFQFPLLGSKSLFGGESDIKSLSFNSLCWVLKNYYIYPSGYHVMLSIPFVGFLRMPLRLREETTTLSIPFVGFEIILNPYFTEIGILSIPFVGFYPMRRPTRRLTESYLSIPFVGFNRLNRGNRAAENRFQFPLLGSEATEKLEKARDYAFQFPLLGSEAFNACSGSGEKLFFQFPLLGSGRLSLTVLPLIFISFNSLCWVQKNRCDGKRSKGHC